jgi:uncharacterized alpha/beta hydrolase family protein
MKIFLIAIIVQLCLLRQLLNLGKNKNHPPTQSFVSIDGKIFAKIIQPDVSVTKPLSQALQRE